tara:strand:- start:6661 stop:7404 length:744 start_codon:yes stop_codon:yes gene_type:complete
MSRPFNLLPSFITHAMRRSILDRTLFFVLLSSITFSSIAAGIAGQFYRYKNEHNQLVLTQTLPAKYAEKGYDILNEKGRLIKTIPPALTAEQITQRDAAIEAERLALIEKQKQDAIDDELKKLYSQSNDAVRVLNRRVLDIEDIIKIKRTTIKNLESQVFDEESLAAKRQRKGLSVGDDALAKLSSLTQEIAHTRADIKELYHELDRVVIEFDKKIKRLEVITKHKATDYPDVLESIANIRQSISME